MTKAFIITVVVVVLSVMGGYLYLNRLGGGIPFLSKQTEQTTDGSGQGDKIDFENKGASETVQLKEQKGSKQSGKATLTEVEGKYTLVKIELSGDIVTGEVQPAHIVSGDCKNPGLIKYPLASVVNGKVDSLINKRLDELKLELPLALVVYKSVKSSEISSCVELSV